MKHLLPILLLLPFAACYSSSEAEQGGANNAVSEPEQLPTVRYYLIADT